LDHHVDDLDHAIDHDLDLDTDLDIALDLDIDPDLDHDLDIDIDLDVFHPGSIMLFSLISYRYTISLPIVLGGSGSYVENLAGGPFSAPFPCLPPSTMGRFLAFLIPSSPSSTRRHPTRLPSAHTGSRDSRRPHLIQSFSPGLIV